MKEPRRTLFETAALVAAVLFLSFCVRTAIHSTQPVVAVKTIKADPFSYHSTTKQDTLAVGVPSQGHELDLESLREVDDQDAEVLLRIAMAEAEGESTEGKAMVMLVIMNRVKDGRFPGTVRDVVFQTLSGCYQFSTVASGGRYWTKAPSDDCRAALELVESGWDQSRGALYFDSIGKGTWQARNCDFLFKLGGHYFYR